MASIEVHKPPAAAPPRADTMRAAVVEDFAKPLVMRDAPKPTAGHGEIVVRMETSGLCHTDIHAAHGDWPVKPKPPFIPGHEGIGIVEQLGPGVREVALGDRVAMPWLGYACGTCDYCVSGGGVRNSAQGGRRRVCGGRLRPTLTPRRAGPRRGRSGRAPRGSRDRASA